MSFVKWMERTLEVMAYAWRLASDDDYCLLADFVGEPAQGLTFPGLSLRSHELPSPAGDLAWRNMVNEMRAQKSRETRKMPVSAVTNLMPVSTLRLQELRRRKRETARMPVSALTNLMPAPEYVPDPPALLGEFEADLTLLFDSQRLLFPEHELGDFDSPDYFYEN